MLHLPLLELDRDQDEDGADGVKGLKCQHSFHKACLEIWEIKCFEKGLAFTCPYCRGTG